MKKKTIEGNGLLFLKGRQYCAVTLQLFLNTAAAELSKELSGLSLTVENVFLNDFGLIGYLFK